MFCNCPMCFILGPSQKEKDAWAKEVGRGLADMVENFKKNLNKENENA